MTRVRLTLLLVFQATSCGTMAGCGDRSALGLESHLLRTSLATTLGIVAVQRIETRALGWIECLSSSLLCVSTETRGEEWIWLALVDHTQTRRRRVELVSHATSGKSDVTQASLAYLAIAALKVREQVSVGWSLFPIDLLREWTMQS